MYYLWQKRQKLRKSVLLLGLSDSGKTALFSHLAYGNVKESFTSIIPNTGFYKLKKVINILYFIYLEETSFKILKFHFKITHSVFNYVCRHAYV